MMKQRKWLAILLVVVMLISVSALTVLADEDQADLSQTETISEELIQPEAVQDEAVQEEAVQEEAVQEETAQEETAQEEAISEEKVPDEVIPDATADEVIYNLLNQEITVSTDAAKVEEGEALPFAEDGSFTIELEADAFFPYEVQFTYEGSTWTEWFMNAEDSVEIGGHIFYVHSAVTDPEALNQFGLWVGDDYIPAYPEEKEFTNEPQIALMSMMPLETKEFDLDLSGYFPDELKEVSMATIIGGLSSVNSSTSGNEKIAAWAKFYYYDNETDSYVSSDDKFTVVHDGDTFDFSDYYYTDFRCEMIIGTADQLNLNNQRYSVYIDCGENILTAELANESRQKINTDAYYTYFSGVNECYTENTLYISVDSAYLKYGEKAYLSLTLNNEKLTERIKKDSNLRVFVFKGYYETLEDTYVDKDKYRTDEDLYSEWIITDKIWDVEDLTDSGGYLADYSAYGNEADYGKQEFTIIVFDLSSDEIQAKLVMPFVVNLYNQGLEYDYSSLYTEDENGNHVNVTIDTHYNYHTSNNCIYTLNYGYPIDSTYYLNLRMYNPMTDIYPDNNGIKYVKKAVVGYYKTEADIPVNAVDIKEQLFSDASEPSGGYGADYSKGVVFTVVDVNDELHWVGVQTEEYIEMASSYVYLGVYSARRSDSNSNYYISSKAMPSDADSYYANGYQTVFLLDSSSDTGSFSDLTTIIPRFSSRGTVYVVDDSGNKIEQTSNETAIDFESGKGIQYTVIPPDGTNVKNYWVTFLTPQSGPKLFVNATNDESLYVTVKDDNGQAVSLPQREISFTDKNDYHDVFFANVGDKDITGLYVRLENAENVALDEYWTVGETTTLSAFNSDSANTITGYQYVYGGKMRNFAKVRLVPIVNDDGSIVTGEISGTLVIGYTGGGSEPVEEVRINLTEASGELKITTGSVADGIKYVPYSSIISVNNQYSGAVKFNLTKGKLPNGVELKTNGELYGVPGETGTFTFTVRATYSGGSQSVTKEFTMEIKDNTDSNIMAVNDSSQGYALETAIQSELNFAKDGDNEPIQDDAELIFVSAGEFADFVAFYIDDNMLTEGKDYTAESGSTKITIKAQTLKNAGNGTHTISAEFRSGKDPNADLKKTVQNVTVKGSTVSKNIVSGGGGGSAASANAIKINQVTGGTISVSNATASSGTTVKITVKPDLGFKLSAITVDGAEVKKVSDTEYTFTMPSKAVSINPVFEELVADPETGMPFVDMSLNDWYYESVKYVYDKGLMNGVTEKVFEPNLNITRGMLVTILYRIEEEPAVAEACPFGDVSADSYYENAITWAASNAFVNGDETGRFNPNADITREEIAAMVQRYAAYKGIDTEATADLSGYADNTEVSAWADSYIRWANAAGLINGDDNKNLNPKGKATRAEAAAIVMRFLENVAK